jgi:hypothetical protein
MLFYEFKLSQDIFDTTQITQNWGFFKANCGVKGWKSLHQILQIFSFNVDQLRML